MSFPRYPKYKESTAEWIGEVPTEWDLLSLKQQFRIVGGSTPKSDVDAFWDGDVVWATPSDLGKGETWYIEATQRRITNAGLQSCAASLVPEGSIILSTRAPIGSLGITTVPMCTNQGCRSLVPCAGTHVTYFAYVLSIATEELTLRGKGTTFLELSGDALGAFTVPVPTNFEQRAISAFLDRETAKIDALIAEQQRLIALLQEKRQSVISHAVTKGVNPDAPMKASGVEWIGAMPAHWRCVRNKAVFTEVDNRSTSDDGELLTVSHITGVTRRSEKNVNMFLAETLEGYKCCSPGDLVINTMWAWMGALGCSPCEGVVSPSYNVYRSRDVEQIFPAFYDYLCRIPPHRTAMKAHSTGIWESRLRLYPDAFLSMSVVLPPLDEQLAIVDFLDDQTAGSRALIEEVERAIALLQERRAALISAAVTGKIDVRDYVAAEAA